MLTPSQMKYGVLGKLSAARQKIQYRNFQPVCGEDAVVRGIDDQVAYLTRLLDRGNMELFLKRLAETVSRLHDACWGRGLFIPEFDELARRATLTESRSKRGTAHSRLLVHVASVVHPAGGHTRVIEDIAASLPDYEHVLIITNMNQLAPMQLAPLRDRFTALRLRVHLLNRSGWTRKLLQLSSLLDSLSPLAILVLAHYADSVAFAGIGGHAAPSVLFLHQCDHMPALGASRIDLTHVDLTPGCHHFCKSRRGISPHMLNLMVRNGGLVRTAGRVGATGATCGSPHKYSGSTEFSYAQLLAALFSAGVGQIFHIGDMPEEQKNQICSEVMANGQDAERIIFLPNVPSLTAKLLEISPDFYLVSHPVGGGKATLEAMSVSLPILHARPAGSLPLLVVDMTYGCSLTISTLDEIPVVLKRLADEGQVLSSRTRATYEKYYSEAAFRQGLLSAIGR